MWKTSITSAFSSVLRDTPPVSSTRSGRNTYQLLPSAQLFMADLLHEIGRARSSVGLQFYTFEDDSVGRPLAPALIAAHEQGRETRLMVDNYINLSINDHYIRVPRLDRKLQHSIREEWQATLRLLEMMRKRGVGVKLIYSLGFLQHRAFHRDHRKLVVIDGREPEGIAYTGGFNPSEHNASWNDFMVKMTGDMVPLLQDDFDRTWNGDNPGGITPYSEGLILADPIGLSIIIPFVQHLIGLARRRVVIESAYLWGRRMTRALMQAAHDVEVDVIVPLHNHKKLFVPSERTLAKMGQAGIHVHRFRKHGGMTHAKALLVDDVGVFGSNTFNELLAGRMGDIGIVTDNRSLVSQLEEFLSNDMASSLRQS